MSGNWKRGRFFETPPGNPEPSMRIGRCRFHGQESTFAFERYYFCFVIRHVFAALSSARWKLNHLLAGPAEGSSGSGRLLPGRRRCSSWRRYGALPLFCSYRKTHARLPILSSLLCQFAAGEASKSSSSVGGSLPEPNETLFPPRIGPGWLHVREEPGP